MKQEIRVKITLEADAELNKEDINKILHTLNRPSLEIIQTEIQEEAEIYGNE